MISPVGLNTSTVLLCGLLGLGIFQFGFGGTPFLPNSISFIRNLSALCFQPVEFFLAGTSVLRLHISKISGCYIGNEFADGFV